MFILSQYEDYLRSHFGTVNDMVNPKKNQQKLEQNEGSLDESVSQQNSF